MPRRTPKAIRGAPPTHVRVKPETIAGQIRESLDPRTAPGRVKQWKDMTPAERAAVVAQMKRKG